MVLFILFMVTSFLLITQTVCNGVNELGKVDLVAEKLEIIEEELELGIKKEIGTETFDDYLTYFYIKNMKKFEEEDEEKLKEKLKEVIKISDYFYNYDKYRTEENKVKIRKYQLEIIKDLEMVNKKIREINRKKEVS